MAQEHSWTFMASCSPIFLLPVVIADDYYDYNNGDGERYRKMRKDDLLGMGSRFDCMLY